MSAIYPRMHAVNQSGTTLHGVARANQNLSDIPFMSTTQQKLRTVTQVADEIGVPVYRVAYAIGTRKIKEVDRIGGYRVYGDSEVEQIRTAVEEIAARHKSAATE
jgi:hypothetical protein